LDLTSFILYILLEDAYRMDMHFYIFAVGFRVEKFSITGFFILEFLEFHSIFLYSMFREI